MATFEVDSVLKETAPLPLSRVDETLTERIGVRPESIFKLPPDFNPVDCHIKNQFVASVHLAYGRHYPLILTPDIIWQCVVQGFAIHVNKNAEELRHFFVSHEGKKELEVRVDDFTKGSPDNDWERCLGMFSEEIRKNVGDEMHGLLTPEFSTTGPVERASAQIVMMDAFKEYFSYMFCTMCGIPEVTLEGTVEDWVSLRERTLQLERFGLKWWIKALKPVLDEFVNTATSGVTSKFSMKYQEFWSSIYKIEGSSGGPYITGWILTLFPYLGTSLENMTRNKYLDNWMKEERFFYGATAELFPRGDVSVPFKWKYLDEEFEMFFYGGFLGLGQHKDSLALRPFIGWAVVDKEEEEKARLMKRSRNMM